MERSSERRAKRWVLQALTRDMGRYDEAGLPIESSERSLQDPTKSIS